MSQTTVTLKFRAVYVQGLSQNPENKERLYGPYYFPGLHDFSAPFLDDTPIHALLDDIKARFPIVSDLTFTDEGGVPIFTGELTVEYETGAQSFNQLLPFVTGELRLDQVPQEWVPSQEAVDALGTLLNSILWIPPSDSPRIVGIFHYEYTAITIDSGDGEQSYPVDPHSAALGSGYRSSGGAGGGLR